MFRVYVALYFSSSIFDQKGRVQGLLGTYNFVILFHCYAFFRTHLVCSFSVIFGLEDLR